MVTSAVVNQRSSRGSSVATTTEQAMFSLPPGPTNLAGKLVQRSALQGESMTKRNKKVVMNHELKVREFFFAWIFLAV